MTDTDWEFAIEQVEVADAPLKGDILDVSQALVQLAQASLKDGRRKSASFRNFPDPLATAKEFETLMRSAGHWTEPKSYMTVSRPNDGVVVFYRASSTPRGRKPGNDTPKSAAAKSK